MFAFPLSIARFGTGHGVFARATRGLLRLPDLPTGTPSRAELFEEDMVADMVGGTWCFYRGDVIRNTSDVCSDPVSPAQIEDLYMVASVSECCDLTYEMEQVELSATVEDDPSGAC